jgi:hypothetical protein
MGVGRLHHHFVGRQIQKMSFESQISRIVFVQSIHIPDNNGYKQKDKVNHQLVSGFTLLAEKTPKSLNIHLNVFMMQIYMIFFN